MPRAAEIATKPQSVTDDAAGGVTTVPMQPAPPAPAEDDVPAATSAVVEADRAGLEATKDRTTFRLSLSRGVTAEVFTLANPYRVIVDLPHVTFRLPADAGRDGTGLVKAFRYGLFAEGKARVVLDTTGPVRIGKAAMSAAPGRAGVELTIDLIPTPAASFGQGTGAGRSPKPAPPKAAVDAPLMAGKVNAKPVILIDPGHGGIDGGAVGGNNLIEKTIALSVAKELGRKLTDRGKYDVRMTRSSDVFVPLDRRVQISREAGADLFISLHADAIAEAQFAHTVRGATVYTLSGRASDEQARRMAEKENASDLVAGLDVAEGEEGDEVRNILIDLMKRETANFSADFSKVLVGKLGKAITLSKDPQRSAAFKVLKQTHAPSVLIELGYMSHAEDQKLLGSPEWQGRVAQTIADAVDAYFSKRKASKR